MKMIDGLLPGISAFVVLNAWRLLGILIVSAVSVYWCIPVIIVLLLVVAYIRNYCIVVQNDAQRLESQTKGPVGTQLNSAVDGLITIRAYNQFAHFKKAFYVANDINTNQAFTHLAVSRWLASRMDLAGTIFIFVNAIVVSVVVGFFGGLIDLVLVAVTVQYSTEISYILNFILRFLSDIENYMTSTQRVIEYADMETEDELVLKTDP